MRATICIAAACAGLVFADSSFGQHLGEVICRADAVFLGTVTAIRRADQAGKDATPPVILGVDVDEVLAGSVRGRPVRLQSTTAARLLAGSRRVFLLSAGKLLRIEPVEHAAIAKKLALNPTTCKQGR